MVRYGAKWPRHDMTPMIPLMSRAAQGVGFAMTLSTTYHHPFHCARVFNALDHVTHGRIAWNAVTSAYKNEAANYGFDVMMDHDERYERAQEFLQVACALWDSVEPDALVLDREKGIYCDPSKVHRIDHRGRYFNVRGPLPALPSPQRRPVIIQAGLSGPGMNLAATYADLQFSTRRSLPSMKQHRAELDAKLAAVGRKPRDIGILWSIRIQVADSDAACAGDGTPLPRIDPAGSRPRRNVGAIRRRFLDREARHAALRLRRRRFAVRKAISAASRKCSRPSTPSSRSKTFGRRFLVDRILVASGTPKAIVDKLEEMHFETGANGGFILGRGYTAMDNMREFVEFVVPELQRRGLSKKKYAGATLRENLNN